MNSDVFLISVSCILVISLLVNIFLCLVIMKRDGFQEAEYECAVCSTDVSAYETTGSVCPECKCGKAHSNSSTWWKFKEK